MKEKKPKVEYQGSCVCEKCERGAVYLVAFPDGEVRTAPDKARAGAMCREWFEKYADPKAVNFGKIIWQ